MRCSDCSYWILLSRYLRYQVIFITNTASIPERWRIWPSGCLQTLEHNLNLSPWRACGSIISFLKCA